MSYDLKDLKKYSYISPKGERPFGEYLNELMTEYVTAQAIQYKKSVLTADDLKQIING